MPIDGSNPSAINSCLAFGCKEREVVVKASTQYDGVQRLFRSILQNHRPFGKIRYCTGLQNMRIFFMVNWCSMYSSTENYLEHKISCHKKTIFTEERVGGMKQACTRLANGKIIRQMSLAETIAPTINTRLSWYISGTRKAQLWMTDPLNFSMLFSIGKYGFPLWLKQQTFSSDFLQYRREC